jgi:MED7 protein
LPVPEVPKTDMVRFGRLVSNPSLLKNQQNLFVPPPIDPDVFIAEREGNIKRDLKMLVDKMEVGIDALFELAVNTPDRLNSCLREIDNVVKNIFHIIETQRPFEAKQRIVDVYQRRVDEKRNILDKLKQAVEKARKR